MTETSLDVLAGYGTFLEQIKQRIQTAQTRAALAVNKELLELYWELGRDIVTRQQEQGWGNSILLRLAHDLQAAFPGVSGFSRTNLYRIRAFYLAYRESGENVPQVAGHLGKSVPQVAAQIPWFHNVILIEKIKDPAIRDWYAQAAFEHGWSRNVLEMQIESKLHERQGKAVSNFSRTLPPPQSDMAQALLKDPYNFDFLTLGGDAHEREVEKGLLEHIRQFLLEMGAGFAFVGSQYHLEVDGQDYYLDLLFYHLKLRCFVVIDLKTTAFQPEFVGKMNFYLAAVDDTLRHDSDTPSIGLLLCRKKQTLTVEYALRNVATPIGVAEFVTDLAHRIEAELNVERSEAEASEENL
ncbi:MAG: PDDEXK nuclease domain-containing protein [Armatimonadota bacterium]|nr:PDDEXK nuclease domain-containing protein [Armatimonadota bacterium]